jgi:hypothetical protein
MSVDAACVDRDCRGKFIDEEWFILVCERNVNGGTNDVGNDDERVAEERGGRRTERWRRRRVDCIIVG